MNKGIIELMVFPRMDLENKPKPFFFWEGDYGAALASLSSDATQTAHFPTNLPNYVFPVFFRDDNYGENNLATL